MNFMLFSFTDKHIFNTNISRGREMIADDEFPWPETYDWAHKEKLGAGSYGLVFKVKNLKDGQFYAIKQFNMQPFLQDSMLLESLKKEIAITKQVDSEHTVRMLDYKMNKHFTYMVLQLCDGDLRNVLCSRKVTQVECVQIFDDLMLGFKSLIQKGYIHRDIKPANVLIKKTIYKVADFGFTTKADISGKQKLNDICGTPIYMAPQLLNDEPYTAKCDVWSLGLMLFQMIFGYPPWPCRNRQEYVRGIFTKPLSFPYDAAIGSQTKDFLQKSLVVDEGKRMGWNEVFEHPLIKNKSAGQVSKPAQIDPSIKDLLKRVQLDIIRRKNNLQGILTKYKTHQFLDHALFLQFAKQLCPNITSNQIELLFKHYDKNKDGKLSRAQLEEKIGKIDYRDASDVTARKLQEIVAIIVGKGIQPDKIFEVADLNHSGSLDWFEFGKFIQGLAPAYRKQEALQLYRLFDLDKSGLIDKKEFMKIIETHMPNKMHDSKQRAEQNLQNLKAFLKQKGLTAASVFKTADKNHDFKISSFELQDALNKIDFKITKEEAIEVFNLIDSTHDGSIKYQQLVQAIK